MLPQIPQSRRVSVDQNASSDPMSPSQKRFSLKRSSLPEKNPSANSTISEDYYGVKERQRVAQAHKEELRRKFSPRAIDKALDSGQSKVFGGKAELTPPYNKGHLEGHMFGRRDSKEALKGLTDKIRRPHFGPVTPRNKADPMKYIAHLAQSQGGGASRLSLSSSKNINQSPAMALGSSNRSPSTLLNLRIKSSKAFEYTEQQQLQDLMGKLETNQIVNKREDIVRQKHIQTIKTGGAKQGPVDDDNVVMKALQTEKDRLIYQRASIPFDEKATGLKKQLGGGRRSRSTIGNFQRTLEPHKLSEIEQLGLCDPDGTLFKPEKVTQTLASVHSYKYLQNKYMEAVKQTDKKRVFLKEYAKMQLQPSGRGPLAVGKATISRNEFPSSDRFNSRALSSAHMPLTQQENYQAMLRIFERPGVKPIKQEDLEEQVKRANQIRSKNKSSITPSSVNQDNYDPITSAIIAEPSLKEKQTPSRMNQQQLLTVKNQLKLYIKRQLRIAKAHQPHMSFGVAEATPPPLKPAVPKTLSQILFNDLIQQVQNEVAMDYGSDNVYQILSISRNQAMSGHKNLERRSSAMTLDEQQDELAHKTQAQYVTEAISGLDNHEIAMLSEILLGAGENKGQNIVKQIESDQVAHRLQMAFEMGAKTPLAQKVGVGLGIEERMNQGINLKQMGEYITTNKIKSQPNAMMYPTNSNQYKLKIDKFQDKIKVKKFNFEVDDGTSSRFLHNTLSKPALSNQGGASPGGSAQSNYMNSHPSYMGLGSQKTPIEVGESTRLGGNPFMQRNDSLMSIQQMNFDPDFRIPEETRSMIEEEELAITIPDPTTNSNAVIQQTVDSVPKNQDITSPASPSVQEQQSPQAIKVSNLTTAQKQRSPALSPVNQISINSSSRDKVLSMQNSPVQAIEMQEKKTKVAKPDLEIKIEDGPQIDKTNTILGIIEEKPQKLFNLNERTIAGGPDTSKIYNLIDDFFHIERQALENDGERFHEILRNVIRAINPIFSGDVGVSFYSQQLNATNTNLKMKPSVSFLADEYQFDQDFYVKLVSKYDHNLAIDDEVTKNANQPVGRKNKQKKNGAEIITILKHQYNSGIVKSLLFNQKMLQRIVTQQEIMVEEQFYNRLFKKQNPISIKSPFLNQAEITEITNASEKLVPVLMSSHKSLQGSIPCARQQLGCAYAMNKFWFFAGNGGKPLQDMRTLHLPTKDWKQISEVTQHNNFKDRYAHTLSSYLNRYLVLYGGGSQFFQASKRRETLSDLWVYDCLNKSKKWVQFRSQNSSERSEPYELELRHVFMLEARVDQTAIGAAQAAQEQDIKDYGAPVSRMSHVAGIYGGCLVVHGGYCGETDDILDDFGLFDISMGKWVRFKQPKSNRQEAFISARYNHTMTIVQDPHIRYELRNSRLMWIQDPWYLASQSLKRGNEHKQSPSAHTSDNTSDISESNRQKSADDQSPADQRKLQPKYGSMQGIWIFGGLSESKKPLNDLYLIQPHYHKNIKYLTRNTSTYKRQKQRNKAGATICYRVTEIEAVGGGRPPCPRHSHASSFVRKYLVIHGGRNDEIFTSKIKNIGLNDLHLFDITTLTWMAVAIYNELPTSRWSHVMVSEENSDDYESNKLIIFGGVNMQSYCDSTFYEFDFDEREAVQFLQRGEHIVDVLREQRSREIAASNQYSQQF